MENTYSKIQELLHQKADFQARLNLLPYDGTPEVKDRDGQKYLYIRKRVGSRLTSTYVDVYSEDLYQLLLRNNREARELRKQIRHIEKDLAALGYEEADLPPRVMLNLDFARANMKANIYDQAVLEGVATTFPQTADIIDNGIVTGMTASDVQKILNLKHAWEFILDKDVFSRYFRGGKVNDGIHCVCCLYPPIIDKMGIVTVKGCRVITNKVRHGNFINSVMQQQRNNRMPEFTSCRSKRKP